MPVNGAWDSSAPNSGSGWTFSNGDKTAAPNGSGTNPTAFSTNTQSGTPALVYFEITVTTTGHMWVGVGDSASVTGSTHFALLDLDGTASGIVMRWLLPAGGFSTGLATPSAGDVLAFAINLGGLVWVKNLTAGTDWNGNIGADPATGLGGVTAPLTGTTQYIAAQNNVTAGGSLTVNTGTTTLTGALPSGYVAWYAPAVASSEDQYHQPWSSIGVQNIMVGA